MVQKFFFYFGIASAIYIGLPYAYMMLNVFSSLKQALNGVAP